MTNPIDDLSEAATLFVIGSNTTEEHPVIALQIKEAVRKGAKLIVADPRQIDLCRFSTIWLRQRPGTDIALLSAMMKVIMDERLEDGEFIQARTEGFDDFAAAIRQVDLRQAAQITGVALEDIVKAARVYATNPPAAIVYAMGITQHSHGTDNVLSLANLALMTGNVGKPYSGVNPLRGQNNVQGACDMGALPATLPGYQPVADDGVRERFEDAWGMPVPQKPGLTLGEMMAAARSGEVRAMYIVGENPVLSDPDANHVRRALQNLDFLVVQDIFLTETARLADVVLPAASFAEKDGTFTNTERRVQRVRKAIAPLADARPDWQVTSSLAKRLGACGFDYAEPAAIFGELARVTPSYRGISYERLESGGIQWPCPDEAHPGTPRLHVDGFCRPSKKGKFTPVAYSGPVEQIDEDYPLLLITGRRLFHYHTGVQTRRVRGLEELCPEEFVEISPEDGERLGIEDGDTVRVSSRRGELEAKARVTERSSSGSVFMSFHFHESPANVLTNPAVDPVSKIPEFKVCAVRVERI